MAGESVNPYAPPVEDVGDEPSKEHLWCVVDGYLAVRHNAFLPPVDLEGDGSDGPLTPVIHTHFPKTRPRNGTPAQVKFRGYTSTSSFEKRAKRRQTITRLSCAGLMLFLIGMASDYLPEHVPSAIITAGKFTLVTGLVTIIVAVIWNRFPSGVRCRGERDGWFYLSGISPKSLAQFSARSHEGPVMVKRKAYRFFSHRLPLFTLIPHQRFNPFAILVVAIMKARRSPALESLHLHYSEEQRRGPDKGDPVLIEQWKKEAAGTELESWRAISAKSSHSASGFMKTESVIYLSPDGYHSAALSISRFSNGRATAINTRTVFRSWTESQCIQSTTPPCTPVHSRWIDRQECRGRLPRLLHRHLTFVADRPLIPIGSDAQLFALLEKELEEEYATLQAAGFQSPIEVMEFPEYPASPAMR